MRPTLFTGSALLTVSLVGCAPSPDEVCRRMVDQLCERNFACRTDKDTPTFQYVFGADVAACKTKFYDANGCDARTEDAQNCVGSNAGKSQFSASRFSDCQDALESLSCQAYINQQNDPSQAPAVCGKICE
ncbi:hypothetical protein [Vitiosangium sp. GDMCC 1.1324]|uniref:hypothetical protein n=1 Tax=Vitiosangium sp. (strain GDMCC 1.1324) TaxID=2138576 RepID=UPI000D39D10C|nr:hypothetical protein [Vitiosangium sp. GDMCC 1.1324]PTL80555.1 hypothetical protein DAT35_28410 [Vitiosangium sp. GDMCC 1.1324]